MIPHMGLGEDERKYYPRRVPRISVAAFLVVAFMGMVFATVALPGARVYGFFWTNLAVDNWGTPYPDFSFFYDKSECDAKAKDYASEFALFEPPECYPMSEAEARHERWIIEKTRLGQGA